MPVLVPMPPITILPQDLRAFGQQWEQNGSRLLRTPPYSSTQLGNLADAAVGNALATMLGNLPAIAPLNGNSLIPPQADCVEVGDIRIIGGVRPQNFDVGYRPDGVRFAFDSKTLNDLKSVAKNYQNMINDLATEATTVHTRFPYAVVAFMVLIPAPCLIEPHRSALIGRLEGLSRRIDVGDPPHAAESIALVVWDPGTGQVDDMTPPPGSLTRIETFSAKIQQAYFLRYQGLQPHIG